MPPTFNPIPRKTRGSIRHMGRATQVTSIADLARAEEMAMDGVLESAIDQLEAQNRDDGSVKLADLVVPFGDLGIQKTTRFEFEPSADHKKWPGPSHGDHPLHESLATTSTCPKPIVPSERYRRLKAKATERTSRLGKAKLFTSVFKLKSKAQQQPAPPSDRRSVASRDPPLNIFSLPAELRNAIWALLAIRKESIDAQIRKIRFCKPKRSQTGTAIRKYPQEPRASMVNRQMRQEILSIFYGSNLFAFEKYAFTLFKDFSMTNPTNMIKWKPGNNLASYFSRVDLRFAAYTPDRSLSTAFVVYRLRRAENKTTLTINVEKKSAKLDYCLCAEKVSVRDDLDLLEVAISVVNQRLALGISDRSKDGKLVDEEGKCCKCKKETLQYAGKGL